MEEMEIIHRGERKGTETAALTGAAEPRHKGRDERGSERRKSVVRSPFGTAALHLSQRTFCAFA